MKKIKVNIGGGNFRQDGWLNVDYPFPAQEHKRDFKLIDIPHNLMEKKPLAIDDESVDVIYTEHCIEHLTDDVVDYVLKDIHRIMKPGAAFRISCPDADIVYNAYADRDHLGFNKRFINDPPEVEMLDVLATPLIGKIDLSLIRQNFVALGKTEFLQWLTRSLGDVPIEEQAKTPGAHLSWWNQQKLKRTLDAIGFRKAHVCGQRESRCEDFRQDYIDRTAPKYSMRMECAK